MGWLDRIFKKPKATVVVSERAEPPVQALLIELDGVSLPDEVYEECDVDRLEEQLTEALADLGEFDGDEQGPETTTLFLYGPDAEAMFRAVEPVLLNYPLAAGSKVTIRQGEPGAQQRLVQIPKSVA